MTDKMFTPSREEISRRAYDIYVARERKNGGDINDWLAAEQELRERHSGDSQTKTAALKVSGTSMERADMSSERNAQSAVRENAARENPARETFSREDVLGENNPRTNVAGGTVAPEGTEPESEKHFKLPHYFSGSNP